MIAVRIILSLGPILLGLVLSLPSLVIGRVLFRYGKVWIETPLHLRGGLTIAPFLIWVKDLQGIVDYTTTLVDHEDWHSDSGEAIATAGLCFGAIASIWAPLWAAIAIWAASWILTTLCGNVIGFLQDRKAYLSSPFEIAARNVSGEE